MTATVRTRRRRRVDDNRPNVGDRFIWHAPDGATIYVEIDYIRGNTATLICHDVTGTWTRHHQLPLFPSMVPDRWDDTDLPGGTT